MNNNDDPEWEIVDSLPKKRKSRKSPIKFRISKKFLIGAGIGLAIAIISPRFVVNLIRNLIVYWWLFVAIAAYWYVRRRARR